MSCHRIYQHVPLLSRVDKMNVISNFPFLHILLVYTSRFPVILGEKHINFSRDRTMHVVPMHRYSSDASSGSCIIIVPQSYHLHNDQFLSLSHTTRYAIGHITRGSAPSINTCFSPCNYPSGNGSCSGSVSPSNTTSGSMTEAATLN
jgi:hypothetical protein